MRTLRGGRGADGGSCITLYASADTFYDCAAVGSQVHEHPTTVDGIGTAERQLRGDQAVDHTGGGGGGECGVGGDLAHAAPASAGEHQQDAPAVSAHTFCSCGGGQGGRNRTVQTVEQVDETCYARRRDRYGSRRPLTRWLRHGDRLYVVLSPKRIANWN